MKRTILFSLTLSLSVLAMTGLILSSPLTRGNAVGAVPDRLPSLTGCWQLKLDTLLDNSVAPGAPVWVVQFGAASGNQYVGKYLSGPGIQPGERFTAQVLKNPRGTIFVPMFQTGVSQANFPTPAGSDYLSSYAGRFDDSGGTSITGTWVDMRGVGATIGSQAGDYKMLKTKCP